MYKLDDLITEIKDSEIREIPGELSPDVRIRIEEKIISEIHNQKKYRFPRKKRNLILLAATLILILGMTTFAAKQNEWDIAIINFMGLNDPDMLQLPGGEVIIKNPKVTGNPPFEITEITSIGDENTAYIRIKTDMKVPEGFDEEKEIFMPENTDFSILYKNIWGREEWRDYGSMLQGTTEDGMVEYLISIENCENLNRCYIALEWENLYRLHDMYNVNDDNQELVFEGKWKVEWTYSYQSNTKTRYRFKYIEDGENSFFLTKIQVSPIDIRVEIMLDEHHEAYDYTYPQLVEEIHYKNGEKLVLSGYSQGGINGIWVDQYVGMETLGGEILRPDDIDYLIICGQRIDL